MAPRTEWSAWLEVLMLLLLFPELWLTVRRCLCSMDSRLRLMEPSRDRWSPEMTALGERSASGCGKVVL